MTEADMDLNGSYFIVNNDTVNDTDYDVDVGGGGGGGGAIYAFMMWRVLEGIIGFLGVAGNGLVLFVFFRDKSLRSLINSFIINQSLIDFTTSLVFLLICFLPKTSLDPMSLAHVVFCQLWVSEYVLWALFISSSVNLVCITLDRYYAIIHPMRYRSSASKINTRIKMIAAFTWLSGFVLDCYWPAIQIVLQPMGLCIPAWPSKALQGVIGVYIFIVTYAGPLGVMAISYACILSKLRKSSSRSSGGDVESKAAAGQKTRTSVRSERASRNIIKTMVCVSLTYAICWAPIAFNYLVYNLGGPLDFTSAWYAVTKIFVDVNMCANPVIYTMQYQQFQKSFERTFGIKVFKGLPESSENQPSLASREVNDNNDCTDKDSL